MRSGLIEGRMAGPDSTRTARHGCAQRSAL